MEVDDVEIGSDGGRCGDRTMRRLGHVDTVEAESEGGRCGAGSDGRCGGRVRMWKRWRQGQKVDDVELGQMDDVEAGSECGQRETG